MPHSTDSNGFNAGAASRALFERPRRRDIIPGPAPAGRPEDEMNTCLTLAGATALAVAVSIASNPARAQQAPADEALVGKARAIHEKVITLDTHVDISAGNFTAAQQLHAGSGNQVNLPKMNKAGSTRRSSSSTSASVEARMRFSRRAITRAYDPAVEKFDAIHRLTKEIAPDQIGLALTSADVRRINARREEGRADRRRERLPAWRPTSAASRSSTIGGAQLHVARAQRPQPARRLQHRRSGPGSGCTTVSARSASR